MTARSGGLEVAWESQPGTLYHLEFSETLESWSTVYLSGGEPVGIEPVAGNGGELTRSLQPPDAAAMYVRVVGVPEPSP